ncbi:AraC family transcriptional regulator [Chakrabartyella piscis]|uniref:helix-turn-helix transcriptional regulator n=1 Tax=Chakrabartyella piscis TaxID=2918914 RepID=UPI0029584A1E|nr:AraC family transcriptional regulator [Chakrabartyella piscis]
MLEHSKQYLENLSDEYSVLHKVTYENEKKYPHIHSQYEIFLSLSKGMRAFINNKTYILPEYALILTNHMDLHQMQQMTPNAVSDRYVAYFKSEYIESFPVMGMDLLACFLFRPFEDAYVLPLTKEEALSFIQCFDRLIVLENGDSTTCYGRDFHIQILFADILLQINTLYQKHHQLSHYDYTKNHDVIYNIMNYIHENYWQDITLDFLAKEFFINKFYLCEKFKITTGTSPNQYIINCRLMKAKALLIGGTSVEDVCGQVGYNNLSHFSRAFKKKFNQSPKQFQLSAQKE